MDRLLAGSEYASYLTAPRQLGGPPGEGLAAAARAAFIHGLAVTRADRPGRGPWPARQSRLPFCPAGPCRAPARAAPDRLSGCRSSADDRSACSPGQNTSNPRLSRKPDNGQAGQRNHGITRDDNAPLLTNSASSANPPRQSVHRYSEIPNSRTSAQNAQFGTAQRSSEMNCTSVHIGGYRATTVTSDHHAA